MTINANTKIAVVPAQFPDALKVLISINAKLRNPLVRKLMSGTTLARAAKISGCNLSEVYEKLAPLGFTTDVNITGIELGKQILHGRVIDKSNQTQRTPGAESISVPGWEQVMSKFKTQIQVIDVRSLDMPLSMLTISGELRYVHADTALLFTLRKPVPVSFLHQLEEKRFDYRIKIVSEGEVNLLIFKS